MRLIVIKKRATRFGACFVGAVSVLVLLSGCFLAERGVNSDELALGAYRDGFVVAVCTDIEADYLSFEYRAPGDGWISFLLYQGDAVLISSGTVLDEDALARLGLSESSATGALPSGTELSVIVRNDQEVLNAVFRLPTTPMNLQQWLHGGGMLSTAPC